MSRAERQEVPPPPRLTRAIREAAIDLYYHSVRLVAANVLWGFIVLATLWFGLGAPLVLLLGIVAQVPIAIGIQNMATSVVREDHTVMSDLAVALRERRSLLLLGLAQLLLATVAIGDMVIGVSLGGVLGTFLAVSAVYMLFGVWVLGLTCWPIVLDPLRREPVSRALRLGLMLAIAHPLRISLLALLSALFVAASALLAALLLTVSIAFVCLLAARYVLPAADRLEGRATRFVDGDDA